MTQLGWCSAAEQKLVREKMNFRVFLVYIFHVMYVFNIMYGSGEGWKEKS